MKPISVTPSSNWPVSRRIVLLDAWMRNPIEVKITKHPNGDHLLCEDERGVVHYARTDRVTGFADDAAEMTDDFADILG
jgi:hypothetical protein